MLQQHAKIFVQHARILCNMLTFCATWCNMHILGNMLKIKIVVQYAKNLVENPI